MRWPSGEKKPLGVNQVVAVEGWALWVMVTSTLTW